MQHITKGFWGYIFKTKREIEGFQNEQISFIDVHLNYLTSCCTQTTLNSNQIVMFGVWFVINEIRQQCRLNKISMLLLNQD